MDACDAVAKDTANRYEEDGPRSARLPDYPVPAGQLDTVPDTNERGDTYNDNY